MVAVLAYRGWPFTKGSSSQALTGAHIEVRLSFFLRVPLIEAYCTQEISIPSFECSENFSARGAPTSTPME